MPKASRKRNTRAARTSAAAGPSQPRQTATPREKEILPILTSLVSENPTDRLFACAGLANVLCDCDASTRRLLGSHKIVDQLIARCNISTEADSTVRAEAVGALRNLAVAGGAEVCAEMYNKGILPVLLTHLPLILSTLPSDDSAMTNGDTNAPVSDDEEEHKRKAVLWEWSDNLITLIWCIAESSTKAGPTLASSSTLASFLMSVIEYCVYNPTKSSQELQPPPVAVPLSALHALSVLSDSSPVFAKTLLSVSPLDSLIHLLQTPEKAGKKQKQRHLLRVLAISVLLNLQVSAKHESSRLNKAQRSILQESKIALDEKALWILILGLTQFAPAEASSQPEQEDCLQDVQVTLEILSEMCNSLDGLTVQEEVEEWKGIQDDSDDESQDADMDEDSAEQMNEENPGIEEDQDDLEDAEDAPAEISSSTRDALIKSDLISVLIRYTTPSESTENSSDVIPTATDTINPLQQAQTQVAQRAFECLNNLLFTLARCKVSESIVPLESLQALWISLFTQLNSDKQPALEPILGAIWALAQICLGEQREWLGVGQGEVPLLLAILEKQAVSEEARVRCIGALGVLAARKAVPRSENQLVGTRLIQPFTDLGNGTTSMNLLIQALDSLFDIYADETREYDASVFRQGGFLAILQNAVEPFKAQVRKTDKRKHPDLRLRAEGALTNLNAFIQYRKSIA